jgi:hypothetical protein
MGNGEKEKKEYVGQSRALGDKYEVWERMLKPPVVCCRGLMVGGKRLVGVLGEFKGSARISSDWET